MNSSGETCTENIVVGSPQMTVATAAKVMRNQHAGAIVVVDNMDARPGVPVGLVTDRDLVVHVIALGLDLTAITVGDMGELLENRGCRELVQMMERLRAKGVRQIPVMDAEGKHAGLVAIDDMIGSAVLNRTN